MRACSENERRPPRWLASRSGAMLGSRVAIPAVLLTPRNGRNHQLERQRGRTTLPGIQLSSNRMFIPHLPSVSAFVICCLDGDYCSALFLIACALSIINSITESVSDAFFVSFANVFAYKINYILNFIKTGCPKMNGVIS